MTVRLDTPVQAAVHPRASRLQTLDGLRGIAILLVLVHHFTPAHTTSAISRAVLAVAHRAWMGVDLFFALSGYLIAGIQLDSRETPDALVALARAPRH
jgi:peptidoglycan/LPS O-acetylase OafA/YrhL